MSLNSLAEELESVGKVLEEPKKLREVKVWQLIAFFILPILLLPITVIGCVHSQNVGEGSTWLLVLFIVISYALLRLLVMGCIYMYKAFAPMRVRNRCRYTPSCSQYTLISVGRYGIIIGSVLGIIRIRSCKPPNGGEDPPKLRHLLRLFGKCKPPCSYVAGED